MGPCLLICEGVFADASHVSFFERKEHSGNLKKSAGFFGGFSAKSFEGVSGIFVASAKKL